MNDRDHAFLEDLRYLTYPNRVATILALRGALTELESLTLNTFRILGEYSAPADIEAEIAKNNEAGRIQRILVAKIYAEQIAAFEDLGALGFAIRGRTNGGIFKNYMESLTSDVASFFDTVETHSQGNSVPTLDVLLNLPTITELNGRVPDELLADIRYDYERRAAHLVEVGSHYRRTAGTVNQLNQSRALPKGWENDVAILLGAPGTRPTRVFTDAFNKIKHRFMVTENLPVYIDPSTGAVLEYALLRQDPQFVQTMINVAVGTAKSMAELGALIMTLDQNGVTV